ncbi:PREDICTED: protein YLS3-like isoform X2 [Ipomoea nil]|uniref:protein YLS3-like isoform X2 n=1 Tax=Ipomoea nil TaxID=35883 RepID=UPI00090175FC|nr:PREDICTED: protein YLS3-like isoform X2 [Ipomoea nil]
MANNNKQPLIASTVVAVVLCLFLGVFGAEDGGAAAGAAPSAGGAAAGGAGASAQSVLDAAADVGGNGGPMACMAKLEPCQKSMADTSSDPPPECCTPMKEVVTKELSCLCTLFQNDALLSSVNMTKDNAIGLAKKCGAQADSDMCKNVALSPSASQLNAAVSSSDSKSTPASEEEKSGASNQRKLASQSALFFVVLSFPGLMM